MLLPNHLNFKYYYWQLLLRLIITIEYVVNAIIVQLLHIGYTGVTANELHDLLQIRENFMKVVLNQHARNTIFTCLDFEYGFRSADANENASLKRIFIGSKHGMVF